MIEQSKSQKHQSPKLLYTGLEFKKNNLKKILKNMI